MIRVVHNIFRRRKLGYPITVAFYVCLRKVIIILFLSNGILAWLLKLTTIGIVSPFLMA